MQTNREGLTFEEWYAAANAWRRNGNKLNRSTARRAWEAGEDPTEYA